MKIVIPKIALALFAVLPLFSEALEVAKQRGQLRKLLQADADFTGCIELKDGKTALGTPVILGNCSNYLNGVDVEDLGNGLVRFTSRRDDSLCLQAGLKKVTLKSLDTLKAYKCSETNILQKFKYSGDDIQTAYKPDLCVVFAGNTPDVGKDNIIVKECKRIPSDFGWSED